MRQLRKPSFRDFALNLREPSMGQQAIEVLFTAGTAIQITLPSLLVIIQIRKHGPHFLSPVEPLDLDAHTRSNSRSCLWP